MADRSAGKRNRDSDQDHGHYGSSDADSSKRRKHTDSRREREREPERDRDRERDRERERERDRERDRDRDRDRRATGHRSSPNSRTRPGVGYDHKRESGRHHRSDRDRHHRDRDRDRERDRDRDRSRDRHRQRNDSKSRTMTNGTSLDNGPVADPSGEREEGEISPIPTASRDTTPATTNGAASAPIVIVEQPVQETEIEVIEEKTTEQLLEERRARRAAILAKYASSQSQADMSAANSPAPDGATPDVSRPASVRARSPSVAAQSVNAPPDTPMNALVSRSASPEAQAEEFSLIKDTDAQQHTVAGHDEQERSAADYDPDADRQHDDRRREQPHANGPDQMDVDEVVIEVVEEEEEEEEEVDDLFAIGTPVQTTKTKTVRKIVKRAADVVAADAAADAEGYYSIRLGETLDDGRYHVFSSIGKGMFSNVVRARDTGDPEHPDREVAIKIVRAQETMQKAGLKEISILNKIRAADPEDKRHFVRLERTFEHRGHLCLVFESMSMNLREVVKRFGKDVGLSVAAVRAYANQLFVALAHLRKLTIVHADLKPDNILVGENKAMLKVCDLGSAADVMEGGEPTPYLVSRFYRAPEIILGLPYDGAIDVWSIGCTLYELYTGRILFPGRSNAHMLLLMTELRGRFNTKLVRRARFGDTYFDDMGAFVHPDAKTVNAPRTRDLKARLMPPGERFGDAEAKALGQFVDLLEKCLMLDPARRITPREALAHGFLRS